MTIAAAPKQPLTISLRQQVYCLRLISFDILSYISSD